MISTGPQGMPDSPKESTPFCLENVFPILPLTGACCGPVLGVKYGLRYFLELAPFSDDEIGHILRHAMVGKIEVFDMWFADVATAVNGMAWNTGAKARDGARGPVASLSLIAHILRSTSSTGLKPGGGAPMISGSPRYP